MSFFKKITAMLTGLQGGHGVMPRREGVAERFMAESERETELAQEREKQQRERVLAQEKERQANQEETVDLGGLEEKSGE